MSWAGFPYPACGSGGKPTQANLTVGTLFVVGLPTGDLEDITLRGRRILGEVALVAADVIPRIRQLLTHYDVATPLVTTSNLGVILTALETGDVALLSEGQLPGPSAPSLKLIRAAIDADFPVVPIPGPCFPIAALIISGLPAASFVYLGRFPTERRGRRALLSSVAHEQRTLVALASPSRLTDALADLHDTLGNRPLAVVGQVAEVWRGTVAEALESLMLLPPQGESAVVVGGAREQVTRWAEDRLQAEVRARLDRGQGAKEISRRLAAASGWPRRKIYGLAVQVGQFDTSDKKGT